MKKPRKPRPLVIRGVLVAWINTFGSVSIGVIGCHNERNTRRLAAWLVKAADWMDGGQHE